MHPTMMRTTTPIRADAFLLLWHCYCCLAAISSAAASRRLVSVTRGSAAVDTLDAKNYNNNCTFTDDNPLLFGMPASLSPNVRYTQFGQIQVAAQSLLVDYINGPERCGIDLGGGNRRTIEVQYYDDESSRDQMPEIANYLVSKDQSGVDFILGGYSSFLTEVLSNTTDRHGRLMIAPGSSNPTVFENRSMSFGIFTRGSYYLRSAMEAMASLQDGPRTLAVVHSTSAAPVAQCAHLWREAPALRLEVVPNGTHAVKPGSDVEEYEIVARLLQEEDPDLVLTCMLDCHKWVRAMRNVGWSPRAQVFTVCVGTPVFTEEVGTDAEFMIGPSPWHPTLQATDAVTGWSSEDFTDLFLKESSHQHITYHAATFATAISVLVQAIERTQSLDDSVLAKFIAGNTFQASVGEIGFDENGQSNKPMILIQYQNNNTIQTVYPEESRSAPLIYPMPTWEERDCVHLSPCGKGINSEEQCGRDGRCICSDDDPTGRSVPVGRGATAACNPKENMNYIPDSVLGLGYFAFATTMLAISLAAVWTYVYRYAWTVKAAQPMLLGFILLGCLISNLSILFMGVETGYNVVGVFNNSSSDDAQPLEYAENPDIPRVDASCMAVPWLYGIGFAVTFAALFVKIERVRLISLARKTEANSKLGFQHVVHMMALVLTVELIVLISWQVVSPFQWEREVLLEENEFPVESVGTCSSDHGAYFLLALMILHMSLLLFALILSFQTRHIDEDFAESNSLAMVVAFMFQVMVLAIPIAILVNESKDIYYVVQVGVVFLQNLTVLGLMFIPKVIKNAQAKDGGRPPERDAKEKIPLASLTHCKWDEGVDLINELLSRPDMTEDERTRLSSLLRLVLRRNAKKTRKEEKLSYLPTDLLQNSKLTSMSSKYVMEEYGGVDVSDESSVTESLVSSSTTHTRGSLHGSDMDSASNCPSEFLSFDPKKQARLKELLSLTSLEQWGFNIFELDKETEGHPLLFMGWAILGAPHAQHVMAQTCGEQFTTSSSQFRGYFFTDKKKGFNIPMSTLCNYLRAIESDYQANNPYHNAIHAADVLQSLHALLRMMEASCSTAGVQPKLNREHLFAVLLGAAVHDVKHPGRSNAFQVNARTGHALMYNNDSVLENMHVSHAFRRMLGLDECLTEESFPIKVGEDSSLNVMANMTRKQYDSVRSKMIEAILHTDMSKHFQTVATMKNLSLSTDEVAGGGNVPEQPVGPALFQNEDNTWQLLMFLMHLADISGQAKPDPLFHKWTTRVLDEFFEQGDQETSLGLAISPLCDRGTTKVADSQIGFVKFVVQPAFGVCGLLLPEVENRIVPIVEQNLRYWEEQKTKDKDV